MNEMQAYHPVAINANVSKFGWLASALQNGDSSSGRASIPFLSGMQKNAQAWWVPADAECHEGIMVDNQWYVGLFEKGKNALYECW